MGLESPFIWKDGKMVIEHERVLRNRHDVFPVESQIWFGDHISGISYMGNIETIPRYTQIASVCLGIEGPLKVPLS